MNNQEIKELALSCGFKLKPQQDGSEDLNPYVYKFAQALAAKAKALADKELAAKVAGYEDTIKGECFRLQAGDVVAISLKREFFEQTETHEFYRQGLLKLMPQGVHVVLMADGCTLYDLNDTTLMQHGLVRATVTVETLAKRIVELDKLLSEARSNASYWQEHCQSMTADRDALAAQVENIRDKAINGAKVLGFLSHHLRGRMGELALFDMARKADELNEVLAATPQQCLRDVQSLAIQTGLDAIGAPVTKFANKSDDFVAGFNFCAALLQQYAATVRKGGE